jgi:hypothetical protein
MGLLGGLPIVHRWLLAWLPQDGTCGMPAARCMCACVPACLLVHTPLLLLSTSLALRHLLPQRLTALPLPCPPPPQVRMEGSAPQRFCQQCRRFHDLHAFEGSKRSCRRQLDQHNARRRMRAAKGRSRRTANQARAGSNTLPVHPAAGAAAANAGLLPAHGAEAVLPGHEAPQQELLPLLQELLQQQPELSELKGMLEHAAGCTVSDGQLLLLLQQVLEQQQREQQPAASRAAVVRAAEPSQHQVSRCEPGNRWQM